MKPMNQFEIINTAMKVDGYFCIDHRNQRTAQENLDLAKAELLQNLNRQIECINMLTLEQLVFHERRYLASGCDMPAPSKNQVQETK